MDKQLLYQTPENNEERLSLIKQSMSILTELLAVMVAEHNDNEDTQSTAHNVIDYLEACDIDSARSNIKGLADDVNSTINNVTAQLEEVAQALRDMDTDLYEIDGQLQSAISDANELID